MPTKIIPKKLVTALCALTAVFFVYGCGGENDKAAQNANAQNKQAQAKTNPAAPYSGLPVLTQADIENYITVLPAVLASKGDANKIAAAYKKAGWDKKTGDYIIDKVGAVYGIIITPKEAKNIMARFPGMRIYRTEIDLINANHPRLMHALITP